MELGGGPEGFGGKIVRVQAIFLESLVGEQDHVDGIVRAPLWKQAHVELLVGSVDFGAGTTSWTLASLWTSGEADSVSVRVIAFLWCIDSDSECR